MVTATSLAGRAREALARVMDPEIPALSIADLGMIERVEASGVEIEIDLLPTFVGCPAQFVIREDAERAVRAAVPGARVTVRFVFDPPWTTDRITPAGRDALREIGIAPPEQRGGADASLLQIGMRCPWCGEAVSTLESAFGPTPCRSIRYCPACRNPFEGFKTKESG